MWEEAEKHSADAKVCAKASRMTYQCHLTMQTAVKVAGMLMEKMGRMQTGGESSQGLVMSKQGQTPALMLSNCLAAVFGLLAFCHVNCDHTWM